MFYQPRFQDIEHQLLYLIDSFMFYQPRFQDIEHQLLYLATLFKETSDYSGAFEYHIYFLK